MARTSSTRFAASSIDDRDGFNVVLVDGMRMGGNRYGTQTNNIESVEVLKGPSSFLYGRGAVGGAINIVRKKPQAAQSLRFQLPRRPLQHAPGVWRRDGPDREHQPSFSTVWTPATRAATAGATQGRTG